MHSSLRGYSYSYLKQSAERLREFVRAHLQLEPLALQQVHVAEQALLQLLQGLLADADAGAQRGAELAVVVAVRAGMALREWRERRGGAGDDGLRLLVAVAVNADAAQAAVRAAAAAGGHVVRLRVRVRATLRVGVGRSLWLLQLRRRLGGRLGGRRELQVGEQHFGGLDALLDYLSPLVHLPLDALQTAQSLNTLFLEER